MSFKGLLKEIKIEKKMIFTKISYNSKLNLHGKIDKLSTFQINYLRT